MEEARGNRETRLYKEDNQFTIGRGGYRGLKLSTKSYHQVTNSFKKILQASILNGIRISVYLNSHSSGDPISDNRKIIICYTARVTHSCSYWLFVYAIRYTCGRKWLRCVRLLYMYNACLSRWQTRDMLSWYPIRAPIVCPRFHYNWDAYRLRGSNYRWLEEDTSITSCTITK